MDKHSKSVGVELVGFKPHEKTLIASMFELSKLRARIYREWHPDHGAGPVCTIADVDDNAGKVHVELALARKAGSPIITIGSEAEQGFKVDAHILRPIRWAGILHTLDTVLGEAADLDPVSGPQAEQFGKTANTLEVAALKPWYDRAEPAREFQTSPAVLVFDPDPAVSKMVSSALGASGYLVDRAASTAQMNELMQEKRYNCVVLEMDLPKDDGLTLCKAIKHMPDRRRRTAVIILTSKHKIVDRMRGSMAGCDAFLNKPLEPGSLLLTLEKFLPNWQLKA